MARSIDWQTVQKRHKIYKENDQERKGWDHRASDNAVLRKNKIWAVKGKYYGKPLSDLPLNYLGWIVDNFETISIHRQMAAEELQRRYKDIGK